MPKSNRLPVKVVVDCKDLDNYYGGLLLEKGENSVMVL